MKRVWKETFPKLIKFIDNNKKTPSNGSKNKYEKKLGNWFSDQKENYNKKIRLMTNEKIYNIWTQFINDQNIVNISNLIRKFGKKHYKN